jgi:hypothetical protein
MKSDHKGGPFEWSKFMVQLLNKIVLKALGPSLGVNQMCTKKNDHAPHNECVDAQKHNVENN